ncbi:IPT/TIG domain-containing protein [Mucilaginibacter sp. AW1-3]
MRIIFLSAIVLLCVSCPSCSKHSDTAPASQDPWVTPALQITSFAPAGGPNGTTVVIIGTGFSANIAENEVLFNGIPANIVSATATGLTVKVPAGAGTGKIEVRRNTTTISSTNDFGFVYTVSTLAGNGTPGAANGPGATAQFKQAWGVAADGAGNVYVADSDNNLIRKITPGGMVSTLAGDGTMGARNGDGAHAQFNYPHGLVVDAAGNVFVADAGNNLIRKVTPAGIVSTVAGDGNAGLVNKTGAEAEFNFPADITLDINGNLYIGDTNNACIRKVTQAGEVITFAVGFRAPEGITIDAAGNLFVADAGGFVIRKVSQAGVVSIVAGSTTEVGYVDGPGTVARFHNPEGIAIDKKGNLYVGDLNAAIRRITPDGVVSTIAGNGQTGFVDAAGPDARFREPSGIATDAFGTIYVCDVSNLRIRKLQ